MRRGHPDFLPAVVIIDYVTVFQCFPHRLFHTALLNASEFHDFKFFSQETCVGEIRNALSYRSNDRPRLTREVPSYLVVINPYTRINIDTANSPAPRLVIVVPIDGAPDCPIAMCRKNPPDCARMP